MPETTPTATAATTATADPNRYIATANRALQLEPWSGEVAQPDFSPADFLPADFKTT